MAKLMCGFLKNYSLRNVSFILQLTAGKNEFYFGFKIKISPICVLWRFPTQEVQTCNNASLNTYVSWHLTRLSLLLYSISLSLYFLYFYGKLWRSWWQQQQYIKFVRNTDGSGHRGNMRRDNVMRQVSYSLEGRKAPEELKLLQIWVICFP